RVQEAQGRCAPGDAVGARRRGAGAGRSGFAVRDLRQRGHGRRQLLAVGLSRLCNSTEGVFGDAPPTNFHMRNNQVLTVPGRYKEIKRICEFVADGAAQAGFDEDTIFHLELCCDEASTNIIEHAYGDEGVGEIVISYTVSDEEFTIVMRDTGEAFDPGVVPPPPAIANNDASAEELTSQLRI